MRALALCAALSLLACSPPSEPDATTLLVEEARYRVRARPTSPPSAQEPGELRLEVATSGGWHIAPEAPARLDLEASSMTFENAALRAEDTLLANEDGFVFATAVHAEAPGRHTATAKLKFGICEGPKAKCVIVREELAIPIDVTFAD